MTECQACGAFDTDACGAPGSMGCIHPNLPKWVNGDLSTFPPEYRSQGVADPLAEDQLAAGTRQRLEAYTRAVDPRDGTFAFRKDLDVHLTLTDGEFIELKTFLGYACQNKKHPTVAGRVRALLAKMEDQFNVDRNRRNETDVPGF